MWQRVAVAMAGFLGASAVMLGAFHAHGMRHYFERQPVIQDVERSMALCQTAYQYQLVHAAALLAAACLTARNPSVPGRLASGGMILGILLFSGSLYGLAFLQWTWLAHIAPVGGTLLIVGWLALACAGLMSTGAAEPGA